MLLICGHSAGFPAERRYQITSIPDEPRKEGGTRWRKHQRQRNRAQGKGPQQIRKSSNNLAAATNLSRKEIAAVLEALSGDINKSIGKKGAGVYQIPGLCKIVRKQNPARPAREAPTADR